MRERVEIDGASVAKLVRYSGVSVLGVLVTQLLLLAGHGAVGLAPAAANAAAVTLAAAPVYVLNRAWVWQVSGPSSLRREVLPFWAFTVAGLLLSTLAVAAVGSVTDSSALLALANVGAFGLLWVAKFAVLDAVVFAHASAA